MNKLLIYIFLIFSSVVFSQKTVQVRLVPRDSVSTIKIKSFPDALNQKYTGEAFQYDYDFDPNNASLWEQFKHWLTQKIKEWFNIVDEKKAKSITNYIIKALYIIVFIIVLYVIIKTFLKGEGGWVFGRSPTQTDINATVLKEDLLETDYDEWIVKAESKKDFRLAVRYYYLKVLKALTEKNMIEWDNEKTNHDYYREIKDVELRGLFEFISYIYDYCWYGEFQIDENEYNTVREKFKQLLMQIDE